MRCKSAVFLLTTLLLIGLLPSHLVAAHEEVRTITAPEVKNMQEKSGAVLIHVLSRLEFDMQHIAGSINIPINEISATDILPKDHDTPLIFYCMGQK